MDRGYSKYWLLNASGKHGEALEQIGKWALCEIISQLLSSGIENDRSAGVDLTNLAANSAFQCGEFGFIARIIENLSMIVPESKDLQTVRKHVLTMSYAFLERLEYSEVEAEDIDDHAVIYNRLLARERYEGDGPVPE